MVRITDKYYDVNHVRIVDTDGRIFEGSVNSLLCAPDYDQDEEAIVLNQKSGIEVEIRGKDIKSIEVLD